MRASKDLREVAQLLNRINSPGPPKKYGSEILNPLLTKQYGSAVVLEDIPEDQQQPVLNLASQPLSRMTDRRSGKSKRNSMFVNTPLTYNASSVVDMAMFSELSSDVTKNQL